ncbi:hypothetical protein P279_07815 [Rhodobacteraceae bacterium PD-2]|nr:hypothetical protein P279_07815 [Rhodobacteraceae bacterium PD-2]
MQGGERAPVAVRAPEEASGARSTRIAPGTLRNAGGPQAMTELLHHEQTVMVARKTWTEPVHAGDPDTVAQAMAKADRAARPESQAAGLALGSGQARWHESPGLPGSGVTPAHDGQTNQGETPGPVAAGRLDTAPTRKTPIPDRLDVVVAAQRPVFAPSFATGFDDPLNRSADNVPLVVRHSGIVTSHRATPGKDAPPDSTVAAVARAGVEPATRGPGPTIGQPAAEQGGGVPDPLGTAPGREPSAQVDRDAILAESTLTGRRPVPILSAYRADNPPDTRGQMMPAHPQGRDPDVEERNVVPPYAKQDSDPSVWTRQPGLSVTLGQPPTQSTPLMQSRARSAPEVRVTAPAQAATRSSGPVVRMLAPATVNESNAPLGGTPFVTSPFLSDLDEPHLSVDAGEMGPAEARGTVGGPHQTVSMPGGPLRSEPAAILRQVADALPRMADGRIELQLNPEELGRVRFQIHSVENGLVVQVAADRPETLDLMRRHLDQLARDFAEAGYEGASFSFGGDASDNQGDTSGPRLGSDGDSQPGDAADVARAPQPQAPSEGLDIRI